MAVSVSSGRMAPMSNNQWTGAQDWNAQPQQSNAQDWNAQSAQDWNASAQQPAQDWGVQSQDQTTIQPAAQDWNAPAQDQTSVTAAQDWNAQPQQSVPSAPDWGAGVSGQEHTAQQNMQDWNQQAAWGAAQQSSQPQQQWGGQQQAAAPYGGQQQWGGQQQAPSGLGALFDFGFKGSALKNGIGTVYLIAVICFAVFALFELIYGIGLNSGQYGGSALSILRYLIVPPALAFVGIILTRAFLEGMAALVKKNDDTQE